jgi:hypothetical protein
VAVELPEFCFWQETSECRAMCMLEHCHGEETNFVVAKFHVIPFTLLLVDAVKSSGRILNSLFDF